MGSHFLLQCVKVKSESEVAQSCPTLATPWTVAHQAPLYMGLSSQETGVGCHFLLQCMKVKSQSEVAQSCPTPSDPVDCSLPVSSVHGIFQARGLEWGTIAFSDMLLEPTVSRVGHFSHVQLYMTPWTAARQAPLSIGFSRQEHWSGWRFPSSMRESEKSK